MPSAACRASSVVFRAIATDSLAAASQLLADVQRFGLRMIEFRMMVDVEGGAAIDFGIDASPDRDPAVLSLPLRTASRSPFGRDRRTIASQNRRRGAMNVLPLTLHVPAPLPR